jgi:hypothetical protein
MTFGTHIEGGMDPEELDWLHDQAREMDSVVEIGAWMGRNTFSLCSSGCPHVYAVDPFPRPGEIAGNHFEQNNRKIPFKYRGTNPLQYQTFMANVGHFKNLTVLQMMSEEAAVSPRIPDKIDMVFIDGNHYKDFVRLDLKLWVPKTTKLVSGHDYNFPGVYEAVDEYFGLKVKKGPGSIWYI